MDPNNFMESVLRNYSSMMTDPIFTSSDRNPLIAEHLERKRGVENAKQDQFFSWTSTFNANSAPNISLPVAALCKNNLVTIDDILGAGLGNVCEGKFLLCRSIVPDFRMVAVKIVVEDPNGERCLKVSLYNYGSSIPVGTILAIMNPWFKLAGGGTAFVHCENPMHVRVIDPKDEILKDVVWKVPLQLETRPVRKGDADAAKIGNDIFVFVLSWDYISCKINL